MKRTPRRGMTGPGRIGAYIARRALTGSARYACEGEKPADLLRRNRHLD